MVDLDLDRALLADVLEGMSRQLVPPAPPAEGGDIDPETFTPTTTSFAQVAPMDEPDPPMEPEEMAGEEHHHPDDGHDHTDTPKSGRSNHAWGGHQNGRIPAEKLTSIGGGHRLESRAAAAWRRMVADAKKEGINVSLTDSYRDYDAQVSVRRRKGHLVATAKPGTSVHGWGRAVDANVKDPKVMAWLHRNGPRYGWVNPAWAKRKGKSYEPWHLEFVGTGT